MNRQPDLAELVELATHLAKAAGGRIEDMRAEVTGDNESSGMTMETKSSEVDVVTAADRAAERLIIDGLLATRPEDGLLGEEGGDKPSESGVRWLIDPIDGTTNYVYDLPAYTVSIAAEFEGELVTGVVYEPKGNTCFAARLGNGATRNDVPIRCTQKAELATALIATGFGYSAERRAGQAEVLHAVLPQVRDIRRFGSAALDLCLVASGGVDGYYERGLNLWDLAAGAVIAAEAGATVADLRGGEPSTVFVLAAGSALFPALQTLLADADADRRP